MMNTVQGCQYPHVSSSDSRRDHVYMFVPNYEAPSSPCAVSFDLCLGQSDGHHLHQFGESRLDCASRSIAMDDESTSNTTHKSSIFKEESYYLPDAAESNGPLKIRSGIAASSSTAGRNMTNSSSSYDGNVKIGKHHRAASHCAAPRVCSSCYTTKTPLWRSGPEGPKSLCNACGIRRIRRARRTTKTAGAAVPSVVGISPGGSASKELIGSGDEPRVVPFKKRCKLDGAAGRQEKLPLEELALSLGKNTAVHRLFPQEEEDAAVLLMSLSCGLIRR